MAMIINGQRLAEELLQRVALRAEAFSKSFGAVPGLAVILVGRDPASDIYVRRKIRACERIGMKSFEHRLDDNIIQGKLIDLIDTLNADDEVHGILVQLPLPAHLDPAVVLDRISPAKDVDGFHPVNVGRLTTKGRGLVPCTPLGCIRLLETVIEDFRGLNAVVVGKSNIVGKPVALLLLERECTVTVTHIYTRNLPEITRTADILIVAAGSANLIKGSWVKSGAIVIDVGINRLSEGESIRIVGDVQQDEMAHVAAITPVPGGVGPMTIACLIENTLNAAYNAQTVQ